MVLSLKRWKSRSSPGIEAGAHEKATRIKNPFTRQGDPKGRPSAFQRPPHLETRDAGWRSPVARQAHNLKVVGSNPTPATTAIELLTPPFGAALSFRAKLTRFSTFETTSASGPLAP